MLEWLPSYNLKLFGYDFVAGLTIALLTIPHYAKLSEIPPSVGVRFMDSVLIVSSFVGIDLIISVWDLFMFFFCFQIAVLFRLSCMLCLRRP